MKIILAVILIIFVLFCKKENLNFTVLPPPPGASNIIEGDIIWDGVSTTHFINQPPYLQTIYAYFNLDTAYYTNSHYQIRIMGFSADTILSISILNPDLKTPGVYNFQDLDSNHFVSENLQTGFTYGSSTPSLFYAGISYSNEGRLTIDTISEKHISGNIDTYCNLINPNTNVPDTNEVHLLFHFSGDLHRN